MNFSLNKQNINNVLLTIIIVHLLFSILLFINRYIKFIKIKNIEFIAMFSLIINCFILYFKYNKENYVVNDTNFYTVNNNCDKKLDNIKSCSGTKLSSKPNECIGWNNLKYNNDESKFNRVNCPVSNVSNGSNSFEFRNLGPGKNRCYKSNDNTEPLYKEFDKSKVDFNKYNNLGITDKYLGLDENIGTPSITDDKNDTRKSRFNFSYNKCSPDCCPSKYSCSGGCICLSEKQKNSNKCL